MAMMTDQRMREFAENERQRIGRFAQQLEEAGYRAPARELRAAAKSLEALAQQGLGAS